MPATSPKINLCEHRCESSKTSARVVGSVGYLVAHFLMVVGHLKGHPARSLALPVGRGSIEGPFAPNALSRSSAGLSPIGWYSTVEQFPVSRARDYCLIMRLAVANGSDHFNGREGGIRGVHQRPLTRRNSEGVIYERTAEVNGQIRVALTSEPEAVLKRARISSYKDSGHLREEWDGPRVNKG
jgi:hypothetical protein